MLKNKVVVILALFLIIHCSNDSNSMQPIQNNTEKASYYFTFSPTDGTCSSDIDTIGDFVHAVYTYDWKTPIINKNWGMMLFYRELATGLRFFPINKDSMINTYGRVYGFWSEKNPTKISIYYDGELSILAEGSFLKKKYEFILYRPETL